MDNATVPTPGLRQYLRDHGVDLIIGIVGTAAAVVAFTADPLLIAGPASLIMAAAGTVLVRRNSGDDGGES